MNLINETLKDLIKVNEIGVDNYQNDGVWAYIVEDDTEDEIHIMFYYDGKSSSKEFYTDGKSFEVSQFTSVINDQNPSIDLNDKLHMDNAIKILNGMSKKDFNDISRDKINPTFVSKLPSSSLKAVSSDKTNQSDEESKFKEFHELRDQLKKIDWYVGFYWYEKSDNIYEIIIAVKKVNGKYDYDNDVTLTEPVFITVMEDSEADDIELEKLNLEVLDDDDDTGFYDKYYVQAIPKMKKLLK